MAFRMRSNSVQRAFIAAILLILLTCAAFWPVSQAGFVNYDDPDYITQNTFIQHGLTWDGVR